MTNLNLERYLHELSIKDARARGDFETAKALRGAEAFLLSRGEDDDLRDHGDCVRRFSQAYMNAVAMRPDIDSKIDIYPIVDKKLYL